MSIESKTLISLLISTILVIGNSRRYHNQKTRKQRLVKVAKERGNVVIATVVKSLYLSGDRKLKSLDGFYATENILYEYTVNGKKYHVIRRYRGSDQTHCDYPSKLTVYYDEKNPHRIAYDYDVSKQGIHYESIISGLVIFIVSTFICFQIINHIF